MRAQREELRLNIVDKVAGVLIGTNGKADWQVVCKRSNDGFDAGNLVGSAIAGSAENDIFTCSATRQNQRPSGMRKRGGGHMMLAAEARKALHQINVQR